MKILRKKMTNTRKLAYLLFTFLFLLIVGSFDNNFQMDENPVHNFNTVDRNMEPISKPKAALTEAWFNKWGGDMLEVAYGTCVDAENNIYVVGYTATPRSGPNDLALLKYHRNGTLLWNRTWIKPGGVSRGYQVTTDQTGAVYVAGYYSSQNDDMLLIKYNKYGNQLWNRTYGGLGDDTAEGLVVNSNNEIFLIGNNESNSIHIIKYNSSGYIQWAKQWANGTNVNAWGADIDNHDNIYISASNGDALLLKFNSSEQFEWVKKWDTGNSEYAHDVVVDNDNQIYIGGGTGGSNDNICVLKYNATGDLQWSRIWDSGDDDSGLGIAADGKGNVYVTGKVFLGIGWKWIVVNYDTDGNKDWEWDYDGYYYYDDCAYDIACDSFGDIYVVGHETLTYNMAIFRLTENFFLSTDAGSPDIDGNFTLNWEPSINADNYSIYSYNSFIKQLNSNHQLEAEGLSSLSYQISGVENGTHYFVVVAINETKNITSNCISVEVKLFPPGQFDLTTNAEFPERDGSFDLTWTQSQYAKNYSIYRSEKNITKIDSSVTKVAIGLTGTTYSFTEIPNGTYYYKIVALNQFGNQSSNCLKVDVRRSFLWSITYNDMDEWAYDMASDSEGNKYLIGTTQNEFSAGARLVVLKFNSSGDFEWRRTHAESYYGRGYGLVIDSNDNIYASGRGNNFKFSIIKYDTDGNVQWIRERGGLGSDDSLKEVALDSNEDVIAVGTTDGYGVGQEDIILMKYNKSGHFQWETTWGTPEKDYGFDAILDENDNIYVSGHTNGAGAGGDDFLLIKFDSAGNQLWNTTWGTPDREGDRGFAPVRIAFDSNNNIYMVGRNNTESSGGLYYDANMALIKFDSDGNQLWNWTGGTNDWDELLSNIVIDPSDNIYVLGEASSDAIVMKFTVNGDLLWNITWGTENRDEAKGICLDDSGYIYIGGDNGKYFLTKFSIKTQYFTLTSDADIPDTNGCFNLTWSPSFNAANYSIYMKNSYFEKVDSSANLIADGLTNRSYHFSDYEENSYYFMVVAYNCYGNTTSNCEFVNVTYSPPGNFSLTTDAKNPDLDGTFNINWTDSFEVETYSIFQAEKPISEINVSVDLIAENLSNNSYSFHNLPDNEYYFIIYAYSIGGNTSSNFVAANVSRGPPGAFSVSVSGLDYYGVYDTNGRYRLNWGIAETADNYSVYYSANSIDSLDGDEIEIDNGLTDLTYLIEGIKAESVFEINYYAVVAYNEYGYTLTGGISVVTYNGGDSTPNPFFFDLYTDALDPDLDGSFNIHWDSSTYATSYSLYQSNQFIYDVNGSCSLIVEGNTNRTIDLNDYGNGDYYFVVVAYNANGNRTTRCIHIEVLRGPPEDFILSSEGANSDSQDIFTLNWTSSAGAKNYSVYQSDKMIYDVNATHQLIAEGISDIQYEIKINQNGTYYFVVVAFNNEGNQTSNCISILIELNAPSPFTLDSNANNPDINGAYTLSWSLPNYAINYSVYTSNTYISEINNTQSLIIDGITSRTYDINGMPNGTYYYSVVAFNDFGNTTSNCIQVIVEHLSPGPFELHSDATNPDEDGAFILNWNVAEYADDYSIYTSTEYISEINSSTTLMETGITGDEYALTSYTDGIYYFTIVAHNINGNSTSNCLEIMVELTEDPIENPDNDNSNNGDDDTGDENNEQEDPSQIPGFSLTWLLIGTFIGIAFFATQKFRSYQKII